MFLQSQTAIHQTGAILPFVLIVQSGDGGTIQTVTFARLSMLSALLVLKRETAQLAVLEFLKQMLSLVLLLPLTVQL